MTEVNASDARMAAWDALETARANIDGPASEVLLRILAGEHAVARAEVERALGALAVYMGTHPDDEGWDAFADLARALAMLDEAG